ncbi:MAG: biotin/lipoyl-containing protein [Desulfurococcaceae archaeon]
MSRRVRIRALYGGRYEYEVLEVRDGLVRLRAPSGEVLEVKVLRESRDRLLVDFDGVVRSVLIGEDGVYVDGEMLPIESASVIYAAGPRQQATPEARVARPRAAGNVIAAPLSGKVLEVRVAKGTTVRRGDVVITMESMKMLIEVKSPSDGVVREVHVKPGDAVNKDQPLVELGQP